MRRDRENLWSPSPWVGPAEFSRSYSDRAAARSPRAAGGSSSSKPDQRDQSRPAPCRQDATEDVVPTRTQTVARQSALASLRHWPEMNRILVFQPHSRQRRTPRYRTREHCLRYRQRRYSVRIGSTPIPTNHCITTRPAAGAGADLAWTSQSRAKR